MDPLQMILQAASGSDAALNSGIAQQNASTAQQQKLYDQSAKLNEQAIATSTQANIAGADVALAKGKTLEQIQALYNLNLNDPTNELAKNLSVIKNAKEAYGPARAEFDQAMQTGLLDDPIGFLVNQIRLPQLAAKVNAIADAEDQAVTRNRQALEGQAAAKSTIIANTADAEYQINLQMADANAKLAMAKAKSEEAQNVARIAGSNLQTLSLLDKKFDNMRQTATSVESIQASRASRAESAQRMKMAQEEHAFQRAMRVEALNEKQAKIAARDRYDARLAEVAHVLGYVEPPTAQTLDKFGTPKFQAKLDAFATTGTMGETLAESLPFYLGQGGANPAVLRKTGGASIYDTARKLQESALGEAYVNKAQKEYMAANQGKVPKPDDLKTLAFDLYQKDISNDMLVKTGGGKGLTSPAYDNVYTPYKAQYVSFGTQIETNPAYAGLKNNIVHKYVQARVQAGPVTGEKGNNLTAQDQQAIVAAIVKDAVERRIDPKTAAADAAQYFRAAANFNYDMGKYDLFGLPRQSAYLATVEPVGETGIGRFFSAGPDKFDWTNQQQWENVLMRKVRTQQTSPTNPFAGGLLTPQSEIDKNAAQVKPVRDPNRPFN